MTKKELVQKLTEAGIEFDSKAVKKELAKLLNGKIGMGITNPKEKLVVEDIVEEEFLVDKYKASYKSKGRIFILGTYATIKDASKALDKVGAHNRNIDHITE